MANSHIVCCALRLTHEAGCEQCSSYLPHTCVGVHTCKEKTFESVYIIFSCVMNVGDNGSLCYLWSCIYLEIGSYLVCYIHHIYSRLMNQERIYVFQPWVVWYGSWLSGYHLTNCVIFELLLTSSYLHIITQSYINHYISPLVGIPFPVFCWQTFSTLVAPGGADWLGNMKRQ